MNNVDFIIKNFKYIALFIFFSQQLSGQEPGYLIKNFEVSNHTDHTHSITCIVEDTLGMVFCSAGEYLLYYDGSEWVSNRSENGVIYALFRDSKGGLWYGAEHDFGRIRHCEASGCKLESYASLFPDSLNLFGNITSIVEYGSSIFFHSSLFIFEVKGINISVYENSCSFSKGFVVDGKYYTNHNKLGLLSYHSGTFNKVKGGGIFSDKTIVGIALLSSDSLLIGTRKNGVFLYRISKNETTSWNDKNRSTFQFLDKTRLNHLIQISDSRIAFSTADIGTIITDKEGNIIRRLNTYSGTTSNRHKNIYLAEPNTLLMGTDRGISLYNLSSPFYIWGPDQGVQGEVNAVYIFKDQVLVGTFRGLYTLDKPLHPDGKVERVLNIPCWKIEVAILDNNEEVLFVSTQDGLFKYDGNKLELLFPGNVYKTVQLNANKNFFISVGLSGLHVFSIFDGKIRQYQFIEYLFSNAKCVVQDNSDIWITYGTVGKQYIIQQDEIIHRLIDNDLENLSYDEISTEYALNAFNIDDNSFLFSSPKGFLEYDTISASFVKLKSWGRDVADYTRKVYCMSKDTKGNIWLGGSDILFDRYDGTYSVYQMNFDGLSDKLNSSFIYHDEHHNTWIAEDRGVILIDSIAPPGYDVSEVLITRFALGDSLNHYIYRNDTDPDCKTVVSLHSVRDLAVYYSLPNFGNQKEIKYSYMLKGYRNLWSNWDCENHIYFHDLKSGKYTFQVKAQLEGVMETNVSYVGFEIQRLWYETLLFRTIIIVLFLFISYKIVTLIIEGKVKRESKEEEIIKKRINESLMIKLADNAISIGAGNPTDYIVKLGPERHCATKQELFINDLTMMIEKHISENELSVEKLATILNMSQKMLYRRVKSATGLSIIAFIKKVRLSNAAILLSTTDYSVADVAFKVGFNDPSYFTHSFRNEFKKTPLQFQKEINRINKEK